MTSSKLETVFRAVAVLIVAVVGLLASTPNVHGTADTRGGIPCDANRTLLKVCGDTGYSGKCLYNYTTCYSVPGWRYMTCVKKPLANNQCEKDLARCFPRDDYMPLAACTPNYSATVTRTSQVQ